MRMVPMCMGTIHTMEAELSSRAFAQYLSCGILGRYGTTTRQTQSDHRNHHYWSYYPYRYRVLLLSVGTERTIKHCHQHRNRRDNHISNVHRNIYHWHRRIFDFRLHDQCRFRRQGSDGPELQNAARVLRFEHHGGSASIHADAVRSNSNCDRRKC